MFNWRVKNKVAPMHVVPGDTVRVRYTDSRTGRTEVLNHMCDHTADYDTLAIGTFDNEMGYAEGIVCVVGREDA